VLTATGLRRKTETFNSLYRKKSANPADYETVDLTLIPYHGFANRGESEMLVWVAVK
jgi:DUF1680 family protein